MKRADNFQLSLFAPADTLGGGNTNKTTTKPKGGEAMKTEKKTEQAKNATKTAAKVEKKTEAKKPTAEPKKPGKTTPKAAEPKAAAASPKIEKADGVAIAAEPEVEAAKKPEAVKTEAKKTTKPTAKAADFPAVESWADLRKRHADELAAFYKAHPVKGETFANPNGVMIPASALGDFCALRVRQSREFRRRLDYAPAEAFEFFLDLAKGDAQAALFAMGITTTKENAEAGNVPQYSRQLRAVLKAHQAQAERLAEAAKKADKPTEKPTEKTEPKK